MAEPFSRLIQELARRTHGVHGQAAETWGARHTGSRQAIRESIKNSTTDWSPQDLLSINDLTQPPRPFHLSVSVSHAQDLGGWISTPRPVQVGWDVELSARIQNNIIKRVCQPDEITAAPKPKFLWGAKEAFFKALEDEQPLAITEITVTDWKAAGSDLWTWRGLGPRNGEGLLLESEPWILTACLIY